MILTEKRIALFWAMVDVRGLDECWLWKGYVSRYGYGVLSVRNKPEMAHRVMAILSGISLPEGMCVCHKCDVRNCVNPHHFFVGTKTDNNMDRDAKGRTARGLRCGVHTHPESRVSGKRNGAYTKPESRRIGSKNGRAKLTPENVLEARNLKVLGWSDAALSRRYNVTPGAIWFAVTGRTWGPKALEKSNA